MSKKFVFSVVVKSRKKMGFPMANKDINVMFAVVSFFDTKRINLDELWSLYLSGKQTYAQLSEHFFVQQKPFNGCLTKWLLPSVKNFQSQQ